MQANKLKDKHDKKNNVYMGKETSGLIWDRWKDRQTDRQTCSHEIAGATNAYKKKQNKQT